MDRQVTGILGTKLGMTQIWDDNRVVPVTVVQAGPCVVTQVRTADKDGYQAVQLAYGTVDPRKVNKPITGHFTKAGVAPRRHLVELRTTDATEPFVCLAWKLVKMTIAKLPEARCREREQRDRGMIRRDLLDHATR